jgi:hypothetical protein
MSFLAPRLLFALPLAALPVIIHLIHLHRRSMSEPFIHRLSMNG